MFCPDKMVREFKTSSKVINSNAKAPLVLQCLQVATGGPWFFTLEFSFFFLPLESVFQAFEVYFGFQ